MTDQPSEPTDPQQNIDHSDDENSEHYSKEPQIASDLNERNIEDVEVKKEDIQDGEQNPEGQYPQIDEEKENNIDDDEGISNNAQIASEHNDRMDDFGEDEQKSEKKDCIELQPVEEVHEESPPDAKDSKHPANAPQNSLKTPVDDKSRNADLKINESAPGEISIKSGMAVACNDKGGITASSFSQKKIFLRPTSYSLTARSPNRFLKNRSSIGLTPKNRMSMSKISRASLRSPLNTSKSPLRNTISLKQGMTQEEFNSLRELFIFLDYERKGVIDPQELLRLFEALSIKIIRN